MKRERSEGFTLIELLVVIAILGILASIIIAGVTTARNKAEDATTKDALSNLRTVANDEYLDNGVYLFGCATNFSPASPESDVLLKSAFAHSKGGYCQWGPAFYYVQLQLKGGGWFCIDSRGFATTTTNNPIIGQGHC